MSQARTSLRAAGHVPSSRGRTRSGESHGFRAPSLPFSPGPHTHTQHTALSQSGCLDVPAPFFPLPGSPGAPRERMCTKERSPDIPTLLRRGPDKGHSSGVKHHQGLGGSSVPQTGPRSSRKQPRVTIGIWIPSGRIGVTPKMTTSRGWELTAPRCLPLSPTVCPHPRQGQGPCCRRDTLAPGVSAGTKHCTDNSRSSPFGLADVPTSCCHPLSQGRSQHSSLQLLPPPSLPRTPQGSQLCRLCSELSRARERQPWEEPAAGRRERPRRNAQTSAIPRG